MTVPGGYIAGDVLTAANLNLLPGGKMGYAQVTANQTTITTETDLTSLTVTWTAVSARRYRITGYCTMRVDSTPSPATWACVYITDGSNTKKQAGYGSFVPSGTSDSNDSLYTTAFVSVTETGLSGSTTRKLRAESRGAGAANGDTVALIASSTQPAYILVEDIGPA